MKNKKAVICVVGDFNTPPRRLTTYMRQLYTHNERRMRWSMGVTEDNTRPTFMRIRKDTVTASKIDNALWYTPNNTHTETTILDVNERGIKSDHNLVKTVFIINEKEEERVREKRTKNYNESKTRGMILQRLGIINRGKTWEDLNNDDTLNTPELLYNKTTSTIKEKMDIITREYDQQHKQRNNNGSRKTMRWKYMFDTLYGGLHNTLHLLRFNRTYKINGKVTRDQLTIPRSRQRLMMVKSLKYAATMMRQSVRADEVKHTTHLLKQALQANQTRNLKRLLQLKLKLHECLQNTQKSQLTQLSPQYTTVLYPYNVMITTT